MLRKLVFGILAFFSLISVSAQESYFYPGNGKFNPAIPTPQQFLGYAIGEQHTRHDKIVEYFKELDRLSDRVSVEVIGRTFENREQIVGVFTSANNKNREQLRRCLW